MKIIQICEVYLGDNGCLKQSCSKLTLMCLLGYSLCMPNFVPSVFICDNSFLKNTSLGQTVCLKPSYKTHGADFQWHGLRGSAGLSSDNDHLITLPTPSDYNNKRSK